MHTLRSLLLLLSLGSVGCSGLDCVFEDFAEALARGLAGAPVPGYQFNPPSDGTTGVVLECGEPCVIEPGMVYAAGFFDDEDDVVLGNRGALPFREIQSLDPLVATMLWAPDDEPEDGLSTQIDQCAEAALVANAPGIARFDFLDKKGRRIGRVSIEITAAASVPPPAE